MADQPEPAPCYFCGTALQDAEHYLVLEAIDRGETVGGWKPVCRACQELHKPELNRAQKISEDARARREDNPTEPDEED